MRDLDAVRGFLTPAMTGLDPGGRTLNAFSNPSDVHMIEQGYACGECCAIFTGFRLDCPLCGLPTHVTRQRQETPEMWQQHVDQRHAPVKTLGVKTEIDLPRSVVPRSVDQFMREIAADKDMDHIPLSKLKPSKWGRK